MEGYKISASKNEMEIDAIHNFIGRSYWAEVIQKDTLSKAVNNSLCFGVFTTSGEQIGFARMITDSATFAYIADVYILQVHRGKGLSKRLMQEIMAHPDLQGLRRINLATRDAHGLYEKFGFKPLSSPEKVMEILKPDVYKDA